MRIGILGGTFNPIHNAHIRLAEEAKEILKLDKVIFIPAYIPPHKKDPDIADSRIRYEMIGLAIKNRKGLEVSDIEIKRKGASYSVDTLKLLKKKFGPESELFFITGSDYANELSAWKDIGEIFKLVNFVMANRPGFPIKNTPDKVQVLKINDMPVSSTDIRRKIKNKESISDSVPEKVAEYISKKGLYK